MRKNKQTNKQTIHNQAKERIQDQTEVFIHHLGGKISTNITALFQWSWLSCIVLKLAVSRGSPRLFTLSSYFKVTFQMCGIRASIFLVMKCEPKYWLPFFFFLSGPKMIPSMVFKCFLSFSINKIPWLKITKKSCFVRCCRKNI